MRNECQRKEPFTGLRDHAFDLPGGRRLLGRKKVDHVATERNYVQKGALEVRWEKARTNYSKMLPTKRMGIE
ncbi:hypothetical protein DPMN_116462 [Dreissena polymorpha]|uniref:Uncharacterized protein n=1 Tax=Dreissena polymorpha TaxID=45954 RepID=A0A9D4QTF4_DREPO|nr:hypothetical protein DPMN_116462 [Dreissena polymorpha]